jgi:CheY-like chemotaxis protein
MKKILLVEDDVFFQKFYSFKLQESQFDVGVAPDGEACMNQLQTFLPDLILLDLVMPKKDGFSVLQSVGQSPTLRTIPVLVFSTLGQEKDISRAMSLGARGYVNKSFLDFDALLQKINELMQH